MRNLRNKPSCQERWWQGCRRWGVCVCVVTLTFDQGDKSDPPASSPKSSQRPNLLCPRVSRVWLCKQEPGREPSHGAGAQSRSFTGHLLQTLSSHPCPRSNYCLFPLGSAIFSYCAVEKKGTPFRKSLDSRILELGGNFRATGHILYMLLSDQGSSQLSPARPRGPSQCSESSRQGQFHNLPANDAHCCLLNVWKYRMKQEVISLKEKHHHFHAPLSGGRRSRTVSSWGLG